MDQKLGIVGIPPSPDAVASIAHQLGVTPLYLLDPADSMSTLAPGTAIFPLRAEDNHDLTAKLRPFNINGIWGPTEYRGRNFGTLAQLLDCPHLPCRTVATDGACPILDAQHYSVDDLRRLTSDHSATIAIPAWVRASCGYGDTSCMRVEHPSDLSLALEKVRKRNPYAKLRIQPAVDGAIFRVLAFRTGNDLKVFEVIEETMTTSVYRVPLGLSMPLQQHESMRADLLQRTAKLNDLLPHGWGYVEVELVVTPSSIEITDIQAPAVLGEDVRNVVRRATGVDLLQASMECALGREPTLTRTTDQCVALTWLLTRSGVVIGFEGIEEALALPGVVEIQLNAREGDILSHVVDQPSRERGGYVIAVGDTTETAKVHLEAARNTVRINTSPAWS